MREELHPEPGATPSTEDPRGGSDLERLGRRAVMLGAAAAGVGAAAGLVAAGGPAGAAAPVSGAAPEATAVKDVVIDKANKSSGTTAVTSSGGNGLQGGTSESGQSGVYGVDTSASPGGYGVAGASTNGCAVHGLAGGAGNSPTPPTGVAVYGRSNTSDGVQGFTLDNGSHGVYGDDTSTDGGYGVYGASSAGCGVYGTSAAPFDNQDLTAGVGIYGAADDGVGVFGIATNGTGVYAQAPDSALFVEGNAKVTGNVSIDGTLSKASGSFKIDHPLDPGGKYLYHSFVESPDMMNVYNGAIVLDHDGRAVVELPDWFEALNRDFRYQLTAVGAPAPRLHVSEEVRDGRFSIAGGPAGLQVSWQVTGIRQDAFAEAHRIPVEVDKAPEDKGRFLYPELFGQGEEQGLSAMANARSHGRRRTPTIVA